MIQRSLFFEKKCFKEMTKGPFGYYGIAPQNSFWLDYLLNLHSL
jgi:hypothetical protein